MSTNSERVAQRRVYCPSCEAKAGECCRTYTAGGNSKMHGPGALAAQKYNHVTRIKKYEREKASLPPL